MILLVERLAIKQQCFLLACQFYQQSNISPRLKINSTKREERGKYDNDFDILYSQNGSNALNVNLRNKKESM